MTHSIALWQTTIDLQNPPEEPPRQVTSELLWRLAVRLFREHVLAVGHHVVAPDLALTSLASPGLALTSLASTGLALTSLGSRGMVPPGLVRVGAPPTEPRCARCAWPWPCSGRRLAELGLNTALGWA